MNDIITIKKILYRNSMLLRKNNIKFHYFFENNIQQGGGKDLVIEYEGNKYKYEQSYIDKDHYLLMSTDNNECVNILINKADKIAEIHGITNFKSCFNFTNENVGSTLLKITIKMLKKYKDQFNIKMVILTDNSIKKCQNEYIKLPIMMTLLSGDTWYGKYGFRPIMRYSDTFILDEFNNKLYEKNKKIFNEIKINNFNLIKYIELTKNEKIIEATKKILLTFPDMLLKTFLYNFLRDYDNTCIYFSKFYEKLFHKTSVFEPTKVIYGLIL